MKDLIEKYPWISFEINLQKLPYDIWVLLGQCTSKCEHIKRMPLMQSVREELHKVYLAKGIQATTAIEGNTLSEDQVRQIIDGKLKLEKSKKYLEQEVRNILEACHEIATGLVEGRYREITRELLCELNEKVLQDVPCDETVVPGKVRKDSRGVGPYRAPGPADVPQLLDKFCTWVNTLQAESNQLNEIAFGILKAITAHLYIAWIHPFGDGNGRTARLLEFAILLTSGAPSPTAHLLSNYYNATRNEYYRQLDRTSKTGGDITSFFAYAIRGLHDELQDVIGFIIGQVQHISWEHYVYDYFRKLPASEIHKRQRDVMIVLSRQAVPLTKDKMENTTAKIYLDAGKKKKAFTRDINALIKMKLILKKDDGFEPNFALILEQLPFSV